MEISNRKTVIILLFLSIGIIFTIRLFYLQVLDDDNKIEAANMSERKITVYPSRGLIYDRNQDLLVANIAVYDLMVVPKDEQIEDTLDFCRIIGVTKKAFIDGIKKAKAYSMRKPSVFEKQIPAEQFAVIAEHLHKFPGFYGQSRTLRTYPEKSAAHTLGYVGEVNQNNIDKDAYYKPGDYIGANGIEQSYEKQLRGQRGTKYVLVDVYNNEKGSFKDGRFDTIAVSGYNLETTIDAELQKFGEQLMQNKKGSIVAIEPKTGEILAIVTNPNYDPNLLIGRIRNKNYVALSRDTLKPLFNRALMAKYPPGSTFKLINGLIGLQEGTLNVNTYYSCNGGYYFASRRLGCHTHSSPLNLTNAIRTSCNAYFCNVFKSVIEKYPSTVEGYEKWYNYVTAFGLGSRTEVDVPGEVKGFVPSYNFYDRIYRGSWKANTVISLAIGQGELGVTPIQMANMTAAIANRGYYITPHVIKKVNGKELRNFEKHNIPIDKKHFETVVNGMFEVVEAGTGRGVRFSEEISVGGKTGTAQNPHGKDHSIFIAFAPVDDPKIAVAVYVENVGFGSTWAAPINSLMIEKYLTDSVSRPKVVERMLNADLLK